MAKQSPLERLKELDAERAKIIDASVADALNQINGLIGELDALGVHYELVKVGAKKKEKSDSPTRKLKQCKHCQFDTLPQHDGRLHRSQGEDKKAFTAADLAKHGLVRV